MGGPGGAVLPVDLTASPCLWAPVQSWPRSSFVPLGRFFFDSATISRLQNGNDNLCRSHFEMVRTAPLAAGKAQSMVGTRVTCSHSCHAWSQAGLSVPRLSKPLQTPAPLFLVLTVGFVPLEMGKSLVWPPVTRQHAERRGDPLGPCGPRPSVLILWGF